MLEAKAVASHRSNWLLLLSGCGHVASSLVYLVKSSHDLLCQSVDVTINIFQTVFRSDICRLSF